MRAQLQASEVIGGYRIEEQIGSGGMGAVYRAAHLILPRVVALKVLHSDMLDTQSAVERMLQEAQILESIDHPTVVKVYDVGRLLDGRPWVAMELLNGLTLADHLFVHGKLQPREACLVIVAVAEALTRAHSRGVIHRDVKPDNIMLMPSAHGLEVKLIDWGIAHVCTMRQRLTGTDYSPGTPCYMAPEQLRGRPVDGRADTYALGVVAYEMLAGTPPFDGPHPLEIAVKTLHDDVPSLNPEHEVPPRIDTIIRAMLAKEPSQRPSLDLVGAAFAEWAEGGDDDYEEISLELEMEADAPEEMGGVVSGEICC